MDFDNCYQLGYISKTHGLKGELVVVLDVDDPHQYEQLESVLLSIDNRLVPFFIDYIQVDDKKSILKFEEFNSLDEVKHLVGTEIYLYLDQLPPKPDGRFFYHELIDFEVFDEVYGFVGRVRSIYLGGGQPILGIEVKGKEALVPINNDEILKQVDKSGKTIDIKLPPGLLEIYLEEWELI